MRDGAAFLVNPSSFAVECPISMAPFIDAYVSALLLVLLQDVESVDPVKTRNEFLDSTCLIKTIGAWARGENVALRG